MGACLMLVVVGVLMSVMSAPVSAHPTTDSVPTLSSTGDDLGDLSLLLGDTSLAQGDTDSELGDTSVLGDTNPPLGDTTSALGDANRALQDVAVTGNEKEFVPLILLTPQTLISNPLKLSCGEECDVEGIFPDHTARPAPRTKRAVGPVIGAILGVARGAGRAAASAARATGRAVRAGGRKIASGVRTFGRRTATIRRVGGKVFRQVERGGLIYAAVDQSLQLSKLQKQVDALRVELANAESRREKERLRTELQRTRQRALDLLKTIDEGIADSETYD